MAEERIEKVEKKTETKSQSKQKQVQESLYTVQEFAKNSKKLFGVQREVVVTAFKMLNKQRATLSEAKEIVKKFMEKEIK